MVSVEKQNPSNSSIVASHLIARPSLQSEAGVAPVADAYHQRSKFLCSLELLRCLHVSPISSFWLSRSLQQALYYTLHKLQRPKTFFSRRNNQALDVTFSEVDLNQLGKQIMQGASEKLTVFSNKVISI